MTESVQGPERLAALLSACPFVRSSQWRGTAEWLLAHGVSLPDSGDAPRLGGVEALMQAKVAPGLDAAAGHFPSASDGLRERDFADAWDAYSAYLQKLEVDRPDGASLTVSAFLWRWFVDRAALGSAPRGTA